MLIAKNRILDIKNITTGERLFGTISDIIPDLLEWGTTQQITVEFSTNVHNLVNPLTKGE